MGTIDNITSIPYDTKAIARLKERKHKKRAGRFVKGPLSWTWVTAAAHCHLPRWTWHDLRRTLATNIARLTEDHDLADRVLGHAVGSAVSRTYIRHSFLKEKRRALNLWSEDLNRIIGGPSNIVPLMRADA